MANASIITATPHLNLCTLAHHIHSTAPEHTILSILVSRTMCHQATTTPSALVEIATLQLGQVTLTLGTSTTALASIAKLWVPMTLTTSGQIFRTTTRTRSII
ncbi:hypothetical protein H4R35_003881 [Dimargaris xerosporica]|nr:hypothetical protein H4R35_003881 [Dimargaris xerosporica]